MRLGVNIDHVATLRQARQETIPDPVSAARAVIAGGADGVVCHLREDRRHIQDADVRRLRALPGRLDLEMAATDEMARIAIRLKPDLVTIVPEKRRELTTEGGLDLKSKVKSKNSKLRNVIRKLQDKGILVSLFIDPDHDQVAEAAVLQADFIELHTGRYCRKRAPRELEKLGVAAQQARLIGLRINAGHGLDYQNVGPVARIPGLEELNIGFAIIARGLLVGLEEATREMKEAIK
ncbi:MAG: pyridoxine 5'-phosphate synthase [Candidatus Margulisbacteria bacterium]|jgi:pyridoxine 5-phosphate synthase|nr:pyridoxine 5'-phosphate synthase [Candidatus Margulisiibacteriota bacterium]